MKHKQPIKHKQLAWRVLAITIHKYHQLFSPFDTFKKEVCMKKKNY